jgi:hypothetical protein
VYCAGVRPFGKEVSALGFESDCWRFARFVAIAGYVRPFNIASPVLAGERLSFIRGT